MFFLTLPLPPSVNSYRTIFRGRMNITKAGREFKAAVADYVVEYRVPKLGDSKLKITMVLFPRDKRKIDLDNRLKACLDALQDAGVFDDDEQIDHLTIQRAAIKSGGGATVAIEVIDKPLT